MPTMKRRPQSYLPAILRVAAVLAAYMLAAWLDERGAHQQFITTGEPK